MWRLVYDCWYNPGECGFCCMTTGAIRVSVACALWLLVQFGWVWLLFYEYWSIQMCVASVLWLLEKSGDAVVMFDNFWPNQTYLCFYCAQLVTRCPISRRGRWDSQTSVRFSVFLPSRSQLPISCVNIMVWALVKRNRYIKQLDFQSGWYEIIIVTYTFFDFQWIGC